MNPAVQRSFLTLAVPNFNGGRYLKDTLDSLRRNRPYVHWWLQDAGSSDESLAIARNIAGADDTIVSEPDGGQTDALNRAFTSMGGDIIGFLNSDDQLADGAAAAVLEFFSSHPEIDLIYGEVTWIDAEGAEIGRHVGRIETLADILDIYKVWWRGRQWVQPEVFFRRSLWERVGPFDPRYHLAFDFDFWVRCLLAGARVAHLPRVLARFRRHPGQKSRAADVAAREIRSIVEHHLPRAPVPVAVAQRLHAQIDYDRYQLGEEPYADRKPTFLSYLLSHPRAWTLPAIRERVWLSAAKLLRA